MTGLGPSAAVAASHIVMIVTIALLIVRLMHLRGQPRPHGGGDWVFPTSICYAGAALLVERLYYVAARLLRPHGVDLWSLHPAPAILAALVALSVYSLHLPVFRGRGMTPRKVRHRSLIDLTALAALWLIVERALS